MKMYMADFETTTSKYSENTSQVWAYYIENIEDEEDNKLGINIDDFFNYLNNMKLSCKVFFHNLNWDGEFLLHWLVDNANYRKQDTIYLKLNKNEFCFMSDKTSNFYKITYKNINGAIITFQCSLKLLLASVSNLIGVEKEKIDYDIIEIPKSIYDLSEEQITYIKNDVKYVIPFLKNLLKNFGKLGLTIASTAQRNLKDTMPQDFDKLFKGKIKGGKIINGLIYEGEWDEYNKGFRGGYCNLREGDDNVLLENIRTIDVNSLYPHILYNFELPFGEVQRCNSKTCKHFKLLKINVSANLKPMSIPFIPKSRGSFMNIQYEKIFDREVIYLTELEWNLMLKWYDVSSYTILKSYHFNQQKGMFKEFYDYWQKEKQNSQKKSAQYQLSKTIQNAIYGKFAMNYKRKKYFLRKATQKEMERKVAKYGKNGDWIMDFDFDLSEPVYIPIGLAITSYARCVEIEVVNLVNQCNHIKNGGFHYADTDSIHFTMCDTCWEKLKKIIKIHDSELGAWDLEGEFKYGFYIGRKQYIEFNDLDSTERNKGFCGIDLEMFSEYTNREIIEGNFKMYKKSKKKVNGGVQLITKELKEKKKWLKKKTSKK